MRSLAPPPHCRPPPCAPACVPFSPSACAGSFPFDVVIAAAMQGANSDFLRALKFVRMLKLIRAVKVPSLPSLPPHQLRTSHSAYPADDHIAHSRRQGPFLSSTGYSPPLWLIIEHPACPPPPALLVPPRNVLALEPRFCGPAVSLSSAPCVRAHYYPWRYRSPDAGHRWRTCRRQPGLSVRFADGAGRTGMPSLCPPRRRGELPARRAGYGRSKSRPVPVRLHRQPEPPAFCPVAGSTQKMGGPAAARWPSESRNRCVGVRRAAVRGIDANRWCEARTSVLCALPLC